MQTADASYDWYKDKSILTRRLYRLSEVLLVFFSAAIPLSVVIAPDFHLLPALIGFAIVVISGLKSIFNWHENYIRFNHAREAVEAERRRYKSLLSPYDNNETRDGILLESVTRIEQQEMANWTSIASNNRAQTNPTETPSIQQ
ncbi:DUF4231 domain-containing protein [Actinokineospora sp. G85]|uniref:DUF4231 domain-containing protein n=1 Tax=Actinokineospora sp. G85 TaxID=3406626 RepID=UPI003C7804BF